MSIGLSAKEIVGLQGVRVAVKEEV